MRRVSWKMLHPQMTIAHLGYIPLWLSDLDPRPAREQLDQGYRHGGGWQPFHGFSLLEDNSIQYPGDPPLKPLADAKLRKETIMFYQHSWVGIIQPDRSFEIARMD